MIFVYGTDLHGRREGYKALAKAAQEQNADFIVSAADSLPKGGYMLEEQRQFLQWLKSFSRKCPCPLYFGFGNDDLKYLVKEAQTAADETGGSLRLLQPRGDLGGVSYMSYPYVPEYPFGLKDWVRFDTDTSIRPPQLGPSVLSDDTGFVKLAAGPEEAEAKIRSWGTIRSDLSKVSRAEIAFIHAPPVGMGMDVCYDYRAVGSLAVREWVEKHQPLISLHGHIHESHEVTGKWKGKLGDAVVVQPGSGHYIVVTVQGDKAKPVIFKY